VLSVETFITTDRQSADSPPGESLLISSDGSKKPVSIPPLSNRAREVLEILPYYYFWYQQTAYYDRTLIRAKHPNILKVYEISRIATANPSLPATFVEEIHLELEKDFITWPLASIHSLVISKKSIIVGTNRSTNYKGSVVVFDCQNKTQLSKSLFRGPIQVTEIVGNIFYAIHKMDTVMVQGKIQDGKIEIIYRNMKINQWPWLVSTNQHDEIMYAYPRKQNGILRIPEPEQQKQVIYVYTVAPPKLEERYIEWSSNQLMFFFPNRTPGSLLTYYLGKNRYDLTILLLYLKLIHLSARLVEYNTRKHNDCYLEEVNSFECPHNTIFYPWLIWRIGIHTYMVGQAEKSVDLRCTKFPKIKEETELLPCSISTWHIYEDEGPEGDIAFS
jgi:hypothetical protein